MRFKVGDRVWIDGEKFIVVSVDSVNLFDLSVSAESSTEDGYSVYFCDDDSGVKLIVRAGLK